MRNTEKEGHGQEDGEDLFCTVFPQLLRGLGDDQRVKALLVAKGVVPPEAQIKFQRLLDNNALNMPHRQ